METLENLIKVSEENKMNFENNDKNKALNENMNNEIAKNNEEEKPSNNFNLDNLLNNKISMNNIPEEKEKENEKLENNINVEKNENNIKSENLPLNNEQKTINDIITENNKSNNLNIEYEYKDKEENEEYIGRDRTYSFRPKKAPGTPVLSQKNEKNINEFKIESDKKETEVKETNQIFNSIPAFTETIQTKIENNENINITVNDQITNKHNNNNDESGEDSAYKEEEDFLAQEELKRSQKEEINNVNNKEEKKEDKDVDIIEERKEEEEDDNNEIKAKEKEEEEAQKKYLEEQDKRKSLQNLRNEMDMRTSYLRDSVEQKKKQLIEMLNKKKKLAESQKEKEKDKDKDKLNKGKNNDIIINEKKEKEFNSNTIKSAKKKQLSNTVFNRLYNNDRKKEKEKERQREREREKEKELEAYKKKVIKANITNKNIKSNRSYQNILPTNKKEKEINSIIIDENINDENNLLNNSQAQNINFPMINDLKKDLNKNAPQKQNTSQNLFDTNEFIKKFLNDSKIMNNTKKFEQFTKPIMFDDSVNESFSFRPEINRRSKILCNKRLKNTKNSPPPISKNVKNVKNTKNTKNSKNTKNLKNTKSYVENRRLNASVNELLYEDASFKKQRLENICINEEINFKKSGNKPLISKGSANLLLKNYEVKLNNIIEKYSKKNEGKFSIINVIQCLWEIHIIRELLKNNDKNIEEINLEEIKKIIEKILDKNTKGPREIEEIEFIEQLWIKINPYYTNENDLIEAEKFKKFLKLLFSLNEQSEINKMVGTVDKYLKTINSKKKENIEIKEENNETNENNKNNENNDNNKSNETNENNKNNENNDNNKNNETNENEKNNDNNINTENNNIKEENINDKIFVSIIRKKEYKKQDIWPLSKFIRVFFELKKLLSTYNSTKKEKIMENIVKEREKLLTFTPDFNATSSYFRRKEKKEKNEDNASINSSITGTNKTKRKHDFNKLYEEFMFKKRLHEQALMVLRENKERREAKMCTGRPSINRDYKIKNRKRTPEVGCSRNEFLYKLNKDIMDNRKQKLSEEEKELKKRFSFRPKISTSKFLTNKSYVDGPKYKPKGAEAYIKRNRSVIQFRKKEAEEANKPVQFNYDKILKRKAYVPRIKDLEPSTNLMERNEIHSNEAKSIKNNDNHSMSNYNDNNNNNDNDIYFTIKVKTVTGRVKPLKIYLNNNPIETANNFCNANNIQKNTRDKIIQKIKELKEIYQEMGIKEDKKE